MNTENILKLAEIFKQAAKKKKSGGSKSGYEPTDKSKWNSAKAKAKKKFDVYPSAYANLWASKEYKRMGGGWKKKKKSKKSSSVVHFMIKSSSDNETIEPRKFVKYHGPYDHDKNADIFDKCESRCESDEKCQSMMDKFEELADLYMEDRAGGADYDDSMLDKVIKDCERHIEEDSNNAEWSNNHNSLISEADLREWLKEDWVRIDRKDSPPCGRSDADKGDYPKCRPKSSASKMSKKEKESASRRKEKAEKKPRKGKKPNYVSTKPKKKKKSDDSFAHALSIITAASKKKRKV